jgi:hypothetical protein
MKETVKGIDHNLEGQEEDLGWKSAVSALTTIGIIGMVGAYAFSRGGRRSAKHMVKSAAPLKKLAKKPLNKKTAKRKSTQSRKTAAQA